MKILLDPQVFLIGHSGMTSYYSSLYHGLQDLGAEIVCPVIHSATDRIPHKNKLLTKYLNGLPARAYNYHLKRKTAEIYHRLITQQDFDILFITDPGFNLEFLNHNTSKPFVMTVHDTMNSLNGHHVFIDNYGNSSGNLGYLAHKADKIFCVSRYTRNDLCELYLVEPDKTEIVYLANFLPEESTEIPDLPNEYILFMGQRSGRKNFFGWIKSVAGYLSENPQLKVVVTGKLTESETFFCKYLNCFENIISKENVSDKQLNTLYKNALCLVYPSMYEGFGLPVLEAMANGCPVITSNCTSIPEVAGNASCQIDPLSKDEMLTSLKKIHQNETLREELRKKGIIQSRKFSKERFSKQIAASLSEIVKQYQNH